MTDIRGSIAPGGQPMIAPPKTSHAPQGKSGFPAPKQQGGHKKPSQIVYDYVLRQSGDQKAAEAMIHALADMQQKKTGRLVQFGNTVFWAMQKGQGVIDLHLFTEDDPRTLVQRMQQFYAWAKEKGFKKITSTLTDGEIIQLLKMAKLPYSVTQTTVNDGKKMVPAYLMTIEVR